jgi:hypothetical protein
MKNLCLASLGFLALTAFSGCNDIPEAYVGQYSGTLSNQQIELDLRANQVTVTINGKPQASSNFVSSFNQAIGAVDKSEGGIYVLPSLVSEEGIAVSGPWIPREDVSTIGYNLGITTSKQYNDVYIVVPFTPGESDGSPFDFQGYSPVPITGDYNAFYAFVLYAQIDTQAASSVNSLDVQMAPQARLAEVNADFAGVVKMKMLEISPEPADTPVTINGSLVRTGK